MDENRVEIDWDSARETNLRNWDERVAIHVEGYELHKFDDPGFLSDVVADDLVALLPFMPAQSLQGLDLCHLQCHIGTDTLSLARAGARVTGVDFSAPALRAAKTLAERLDIDATWIESDVLDARASVTGEFDVVYTSIGTIGWLHDLDRWATQIVELLRPGGTFYIRDGHPALFALDEFSEALTTRYAYFGDGRALEWDQESSYAGEGTLVNTRTYEWPHPLSEIFGALLRAGLRILHFDEGTTIPWQFSSRMVEVPHGFAWPEAERNLIPCTYTIVARRD
ncbi:class I SAM-dependent methyltransferase [Microbacterium aquimaris]|uniref:class I SAM-dependent methyltransferase n=1 Tax=Microbacterium aquimaris TaxID=459816 RepID=UPI002AD4F744|nr:class I SAM-dependent methyltransferase [Microbacterium aquimaris]MDZ8276299.1 class I SAM-dependent methyltransferase [Microbacterium aquimaris]